MSYLYVFLVGAVAGETWYFEDPWNRGEIGVGGKIAKGGEANVSLSEVFVAVFGAVVWGFGVVDVKDCEVFEAK